jgi:DNA-binding NtrC family response regulator
MSGKNERHRHTIANRPIVARPAPSSSSAPSGAPSPAPPPASPPAPRQHTPSSSPPGLAALPIAAMVIERDGASTSMSLEGQDRYVLGRHDAADVIFDDAAVSRLHGVLSHHHDAWIYEDYGSHNGTVLMSADGRERALPPRTPTTVQAGDVLELGGPASRVRLAAGLVQSAEHAARSEDTERSTAAVQFAERLRLAGRTRVPVFLLGPSGVGKTHSARRLHELSRLPGAFVPVNCARLPTDPTALHSELLGHVRGAYTGAEATRTGKLVQADGGTLFLDEVESLPPIAQGFLLDVLEGSGDLAPLGAGAVRLKPLTFRLVSASKRPLRDSGLRPDLCERLAEGHLWRVPSLADRTADIPGFVHRFCREQSALLGVDVTVTDAAVRAAQKAHWPGEVRMLRATFVALAQLALATTLERGRASRAIVIDDAVLQRQLREREDVFGAVDDAPVRGDARRLTKARVEAALAAAGGNQVKAAAALGIARNTLRKKLAELA